MKSNRRLLPFCSLLAIAATVAIVAPLAPLNGQVPAPTGDFRNASMAQVRDAQGQLVLQGQFMPPVDEGDGLELIAILGPAGADTDAAGEADVEFTTTAPLEQEIEFSIRNLAPAATYIFAIDGTDVATATTDRKGRAEVEVDVDVRTPQS
jgi:hypothetical protein